MPILNSAGLPFAQGLAIGGALQTIRLERNRSKFDFPDVNSVARHIDAVLNKCNDNTWYGFDAETISCDDVGFSEEYQSGSAFWKFTYSFTVASDTDKRTEQKFLDAGFEEVDGAGKYKRIRDDLTGQPVTVPFVLDGAGAKGDPDAPQYITFLVRNITDFGQILF